MSSIPSPKTTRSRIAGWCLAAAFVAAGTGAPGPAQARDYLDAGEAWTIAGVSGGLFLAGHRLQGAVTPAAPRWTEPSALDLWATRTLAPPPSAEPRNFMQYRGADGLNVAGFGLLLAATDLAWPADEAWRDVGQDQLLYWSGLAALSGAQSLVKATVARQRPLARLHPELAAARHDADERRDQRSFWSGHASSAFFASTFLNLRAREVMRRTMTRDEYRSWRWAPPTVLFAWSGWVAYSRVHGYEHWLSDVVVGAVAGWACAELFAGFDDRETAAGSGDSPAVPLFSLGWSF